MVLYADEAEQVLDKRTHVYVYAMVGATKERIGQIEQDVASTKRAIRPEIDPREWVLHVKDVRSPEWRKHNNVLLSTNDIDKALLALCDAIAADPETRYISVTTLPPIPLDPLPSLETIRDFVLTTAIVHTTSDLTRQCITPSFVFEAQTQSHRDNEIDYFVEKVGRGLRQTLLYAYVCRGCDVGLPITEAKCARAEMELADLVAFMVRRYFFCCFKQRLTELPPERLGKLLWGSLATTGAFGHISSIGYPWAFFFPEYFAPRQVGPFTQVSR